MMTKPGQSALERILLTGLGNCAQRALCVLLKKEFFGRAGEAPFALTTMRDLLECGERPARIMADVMVALGFLERRGADYAATSDALRHLVPGAEGYMGDFLLMLDERLYDLWANLEETVETDRPQVVKMDGERLTADEVRAFVRRAIMGLHGITTLAADALAEKIPFPDGSTHLDLGGGTGALCIALARRFSAARFIIIDQAPVLEVTRENVERAGVAERVTLLERNFFRDSYPEGVDSVSLSHILHDWSREDGMVLLRKALGALCPGGRIIVNEWLFHDDRTGPVLAALMSLNMLLETPGGENLSGAEIGAMLEEVGFTGVDVIWTIPPHGIVTAFKRR